MTGGHLYRHPRCLDIDLFVVRVQYRGLRYIKVRVRYWHRTAKAFLNWDAETVTIRCRDLYKWTEVADDRI